MKFASLFVCAIAFGAELVSANFPTVSPRRGPPSKNSKPFSVFNGCPGKIFNGFNKPKPTYKISKVEEAGLNKYKYTIDFSIDSGLTADELIALSLTASGTSYTLYNTERDIKLITDPNSWSYTFTSTASLKSFTEFWVPSIYISYEWESCKKGGGHHFGGFKRDAFWGSRNRFHHPGFKNGTNPHCDIKSKYPSTYTYVIGCSVSADLPGYCFKNP